MRALSRKRAKPQVYTVTDARPPLSEDIGHRERRYLITMGARTACFILSIVFAVVLHGAWRWLAIVSLVGAVVLPYIAVIFANGGREPDRSVRFAPSVGDIRDRNQISGPRNEIGS